MRIKMKRPCGAQGQEGLACEGTGQGLLLLCSRVRLGPGSLLLAGIKRPKHELLARHVPETRCFLSSGRSSEGKKTRSG